MVVSSGQIPYEYDTTLPIVVPNDSVLGISGIIVEQGMFVLTAELRKWGITSPNSLRYKLYQHPDITPVTFDPNANGDNLENSALITVNDIINMRDNLDTLFNEYENDSVYGISDFKEAWLISAYPQSPSGYLNFVDLGFATTFIGARYLRPIFEDVVDGNDILDIDLHWLGGSGILLDIDCGEVIFQPFPFLAKDFDFSPSSGNMNFNFGPMYPLVQTTAGNIPSVLASRYRSDIVVGSFKNNTNFEALESGRLQVDGYTLLSNTTYNLVTGNNTNYFGTIAVTSDFVDAISGIRAVNGGNGNEFSNDPSARSYLTPTAQSSGLYRVLVQNEKSNVPITVVVSGIVSLWPEGDIRRLQTNRIYSQSVSGLDDGSLMITPADSIGYHVMDDALWMTGPNDDIPGTTDSRGLYVVSPYNGDLIWYRPAEGTFATDGNKPASTTPGSFGCHLGLELFGADEFVRISKTWDETFTSNPSPTPDNFVNEVYFQRYNKTTLNYTEQSETWTIDNDIGGLSIGAGAEIQSFFFDGTDYFTHGQNTVTRFTSALVFDGHFSGPVSLRRFYANGKYLYSAFDTFSLGSSDPLKVSVVPTPLAHVGSGIGVWRIDVEPGDITMDVGGFVHGSAKMLRAENHVGHQEEAAIHMIRDVTGSTHVADGVWCLVQYQAPFPSTDTVFYLFRIEENIASWDILESIKLNHTPTFFKALEPDEDFPYEFILHDID